MGHLRLQNHFRQYFDQEVQRCSADMNNSKVLHGYVADRPSFSYVEVKLGQDEEVLADGSAMIWMDGQLGPRMQTKVGSCWPAFKRNCAGESCFQNVVKGPGTISFGFQLPGDMLPFAVSTDDGWVLSAGVFVCGTPNLLVGSRFVGCKACCCGGEGPFLTEVRVKPDERKGGRTEHGMFYAGGYGAITRHEVPANKYLLLDTGLFFAAN